MEAKELRIGNYFIPIMDDGTQLEERKLKASELYAIYNNKERCKDITLTEEWLIKLGFTNDNNESWFWSFDFGDKQETFKIFPLTAGGEPMGLWGIVGCPQLVKKIEFVHQLQNIYFSLTGQELELK